MPEESELLTSPFKKEKLFHLLQHLNISRASLLMGDETFEFIDLSNKDNSEYQLFRSGNKPTTYVVDQKQNYCPICGHRVIMKESDEDIVGFITTDYSCPCCEFEGTQWIQKHFVGHTSAVINHTVESYKNKYQQ
jgi:predicted RNA-binding Zn-ribbon protein involved in translation (DUF1610 family)